MGLCGKITLCSWLFVNLGAQSSGLTTCLSSGMLRFSDIKKGIEVVSVGGSFKLPSENTIEVLSSNICIYSSLTIMKKAQMCRSVFIQKTNNLVIPNLLVFLAITNFRDYIKVLHIVLTNSVCISTTDLNKRWED